MAGEVLRGGYSVVIKGVEIRCDTVEQLDALLGKYGERVEAEPEPTPIPVPPPPRNKRPIRAAHKSCIMKCGRKTPILPTGGASRVCVHCADMDLLQKWKTLERMHGPLIHWDPKKEVKDEPPRPKPVRVPRPIAVLAEHRPRQKTVVAFVPKPKVEPPPAPVEEEPEDEEPVEPKWKFERTNEPLPDVSGMSKADAQIALAQAFQKGCEAAFRPLIDSVKYLIFKHAKKAAYRARGETGQADIDDATSSIHLHIFKRLYTFDATRAGFVTWVGWQCRSGTDEFVMMSRTVRSPANTYDHSARMFLTARKFKAENGRDPTEAELEELTGLNPDKQKLITQLTKPGSATSLDAPVSEDGMTSRLSFMVADEPSVLDGLIGEADREEILEAVESLNEREKEVIVRRFGLDGEEPETLKELGVRFGVVRERVRQIEVKAMDHIKMHFKKKLKRESA